MINSRHVLLTLKKELRETVRDRRTLIVMVLFPLVVYPLLALIATQVGLMRGTRLAEQPTRIGLATPPTAPGPPSDPDSLVATLRRLTAADPKRYALVPGAQPGGVKDGTIDVFASVVDVNGKEAAEESTPVPARQTVELHFDGTRDASRIGEERLSEALSALYPPGTVKLFAVQSHDTASGQQRGGYLLSRALPLLIVLMLMLGAFYPAIDATAGERERGTLETTLVAPVRRFDLLLGKVLAVAVLATMTGVLNLASMSLTVVQALAMAKPGEALPIPWAHVAVTALALLPAALLFASLMVAVATTAKSFKEAQNLLTPLYFMFFIPAVVASMGDYPLSAGLALVPGLNVTLLARDLTMGNAAAGPVALVLASTLLYSAGALTLAARLYDPERLLAVAQERGRERPGEAVAFARPPLGAADAVVVFGIGFVLMVLSWPLQAKNLVAGLLASEWFGMLGLAVLYARARRVNFTRDLGLRLPARQVMLGALIMGSAGWVVAGLLTQWLLPPPPELVEAMKDSLLDSGRRALPITLLVMAVTPAICEEALFRGPILRGLRGSFSPLVAVVLCALAFAIFHASVYRLLPTFLLGVMLSWLALRSGSILPGMLAHFTNNGILLLLSKAGGDDAVEDVSLAVQVGGLAVALGVFAGGALLVIRATRKGSTQAGNLPPIST